MSDKKTDLLISLTAHERDENNVTIAFTMGVKALEKGHTPEILLLSDAVHLAEKNYAKKIDIGAPFEPIQTLMETYLKEGGKLHVCKSCMNHNGVREEDVLEGIKIITADYLVDAFMNAERSLQLN